MPKTFNSTVALQVGLLKHLGNVATVSSGFSLSQFVLFPHVISTHCVEHWLLSHIYISRLPGPGLSMKIKVQIMIFHNFDLEMVTCDVRLNI